jgi:hypothetical protein
MTQSAKPPSKHLRPRDLIAAAKLATSATRGITQLSEQAHQSVWSTLGFPGGATPEATRGITGLVFKNIQGITGLVGQGLDAALNRLLPEEDAATETDETVSEERDAILAALNGVLGDQLAATGNPLATPMQFRMGGKRFDTENITASGSKLLLLIHGACMNDRQWRFALNGETTDHGRTLAAALGYTPIYLRYNTGRHISENGRELAQLLEQLLSHWPQPVGELSILVHSMGGLVARSAIHYAREANLHWPDKLGKLVFLGTPHWGSPLERVGNWVDVLLSSTRYSAPYAKLGQIRSAGVTDLRHGYLLDEDWQGINRFRRRPDVRPPLPLPEGIACYTIAATLATKRSTLAERLVGDGLVPLNSALGKHPDAQRSLVFQKQHQAIFFNTGHVALLSMPEVGAQLLQWFAALPSVEPHVR